MSKDKKWEVSRDDAARIWAKISRLWWEKWEKNWQEPKK